MTSLEPAVALELAVSAAHHGAQTLSHYVGHRASVVEQADTKSAAGDWVTEADRASERAIRTLLTQQRPDDALTGEEYEDTGAQDAQYRWSIDPLDGTANFVRGLPHFATSVAVAQTTAERGYEWLAGAVVAPQLGQMWAGVIDRHTGGGHTYAYTAPWSQHGPPAGPQEEGSVPLSGPNPQSEAKILAFGFGYSLERRLEQAQALVELIPHFANVRRLGSAAIDMCLVAEGVLDAYTELGIKEWDWAAGATIAQAAGVEVQRPMWAGGDSHGWCVVGEVRGSWLPPLAVSNDAKNAEAEETIQLRPATHHDDAAIAALTERAYLNAGYFQDAQNPYMRHIANVAGRRATARVLVAEDAHHGIVGSLTLAEAHSSWADLAEEGELEIRLLAVEPEVQRRGVGRKIVNAIVEYAGTRTDIYRLVLTTTPQWAPAISFYEGQGFNRAVDRDVEVPEVPGLRLSALTLSVGGQTGR